MAAADNPTNGIAIASLSLGKSRKQESDNRKSLVRLVSHHLRTSACESSDSGTAPLSAGGTSLIHQSYAKRRCLSARDQSDVLTCQCPATDFAG